MLHISELDIIEYKGRKYRMGESQSFKTDQEIDLWLKTAHEVTKEYTVVPAFTFIFGGVIKKEPYKVWVTRNL